MIDEQTLVFVDGKQRRANRVNRTKESVGIAKHTKVRRTAASGLQCRSRSQFLSCRFDIVAIKGSPLVPVCC